MRAAQRRPPAADSPARPDRPDRALEIHPVGVAGTVAVVICAYTEDRWEDLRAAVASVQAQTRPPDQIVLVVDYNESLLARAAAGLGGVEVVANQRRRGLAGARNCGVATTRAEIIAFLDDDATAEPGWLEHLVAPFADESVLASGGRVEPAWAGGPPGWFPDEFLWVVGCSYVGLPETAAAIRNPIGASMAVRRQVFVEVGGFTEDLGRVGSHPLGCEETELCIRAAARRPTGRVVYAPDSVVHHTVPAGRGHPRYFLSRCFYEGVSKAAVARLTSAQEGLSSELSYTTRTLPAGMWAAAKQALRHGDSEAAARAVAIPAGLGATAAGFAWGAVSHQAEVPSVEPCHAAIFERRNPDWPPPRTAGNGRPFTRARLLVLDDGIPQGVLEVPGPNWPTAAEVEAQAARLPRPSGARQNGSRPDRDADLPAVTVVVATRERPDALDRCLAALRALDYPRFDVVVVDNAPAGPTTRQVVSDWAASWPELHYVVEPRPGSSRARNTGLAHARGEIVAVTDDDVEVSPAWLRHLVDALRTAPGAVAATGLVWPASLETAAEQWFEEYGGFGKGFAPQCWDMASAGGLYPWTPGVFGSGNNVAFRADFLGDVGGYDETLGPGTATKAGEDLDLFLAAILGGHRIAYAPAALARHHHRRHPDELAAQMRGYGVGLSAVLTKWAVATPGHRRELLHRVPAGLRLLLSPSSSKNARKGAAYPPRLDRAERLGFVRGPMAYAMSRRTQARASGSRR